MKVIAPGDVEIDLGITEVTPTIGIKDYSRRVTDDFGVTTVVPRAFARTMSVKFALPSSQVDAVQDALAELRATEAQWVAAEDFAWLNFAGFYKDFALDVAAGEKSFCSLTVEGLAETETVTDGGEDPSPTGPSTLMLIQPVTITTGMLSASNVPETDWPEWSNVTVYADGAKVIKAATHRIYESLVTANVANDPAGSSGKWLDVGPTNRWAMFDQALGTATSRVGGIEVTLAPGEADAIALLDVVGSTVRVQKGAYDETEPVVSGGASFIDLPGGSGNITVTVAGAGTVSVGTLIVGTLVTLGITEDRPSTGITDYSRKEVDDFGEATIVERAWSKRMTVGALIRTDAVDVVANRIAAVRTKPSLWIALRGTSALTIYGFFKDFGIEVGQAASKLSLSVEGLSKAAPAADIFEGLSIVEKTIYRRSASAPATPTGGSFDFDTMTATPPDDWSISVPAGTDPVYVSDAIASKQGPGGTADFGLWSPPVVAFANGSPGADGAAGAPGAPGANGITYYTWYAYADAPDGTFNFTTGAPGGRQFQGIATGKTTATESTDPADYSWSDYIGPPNFGLASFNANAVVAGRKLIKIAGGDGWNASVHSTESYKGGASVTFVVAQTTKSFVVGLNTDPTTDANWTSIDFGILIRGDGLFEAVESGGGASPSAPAYSAGDTFTITYNDDAVIYSHNGEPFHINGSPPAALSLFLDSSLYNAAVDFGRILSFTAVGAVGSDGAAGAPGAPGANGITYYTWYAYADSADGAVNFTTGAPGGRIFIGQAANKLTATESTNPADYSWTRYVGPASFGLAASNSNSIVGPDFVQKVAATSSWTDAGALSTEAFTGSAQLSFAAENDGISHYIIGLNADPTAVDFNDIDYAVHITSTGNYYIFESGTPAAGPLPYSSPARFTIGYDDRFVRYYGHDASGTYLLREIAAPPGLTLYLDASLWAPNSRINGITWTPGGRSGSDGDDGATGAPGAPGAAGNKTVRVYRRSGSAPSTPTGNVPPSGWSTSIPADDGTAVWASDVETQSNGTTVVGSYTTPVMFQAATPIGGGTTTIIIDSEAGSTASIKKFIVAGGTLPVTSRIRTQVAGGSGTQKLKIEWRVYGGSWATLGTEGSNAYAFGERGVVSKSETFTNSSGADQNYEFRATTSVTGSPAGVDETRSHITA